MALFMSASYPGSARPASPRTEASPDEFLRPSRYPKRMRLAALALITLASPAFAEPTGFRISEDGALGADLPKDHALLSGADDKLSACANGPAAPSGSPLFWLEISRAGKISAA